MINIQPGEVGIGVTVRETHHHRILAVERLQPERAALAELGFALVKVPLEILPDLGRKAVGEVPLAGDIRPGGC